jgi:hypothetical protein
MVNCNTVDNWMASAYYIGELPYLSNLTAILMELLLSSIFKNSAYPMSLNYPDPVPDEAACPIKGHANLL